MRARVLSGTKPLTFEKMSGEGEILQKFRQTEQKKFQNNFQLEIVDYLIKNTDVTRNGIVDALVA